jgi:hypothetical protein
LLTFTRHGRARALLPRRLLARTNDDWPLSRIQKAGPVVQGTSACQWESLRRDSARHSGNETRFGRVPEDEHPQLFTRSHDDAKGFGIRIAGHLASSWYSAPADESHEVVVTTLGPGDLRPEIDTRRGYSRSRRRCVASGHERQNESCDGCRPQHAFGNEQASFRPSPASPPPFAGALAYGNYPR